MSTGESSLPQYSSSIPSGTRSWTGSEQRASTVYSQQPQQQSPLSMSMMGGGRVQPMSVQAPGSWQGMHQQSALPSPTPSISNQQQPSYPSATTQQQSSSLFGDPGAAGSIPRHYYSNSYQYPPQGQYQSPHSGDVQHAYPDLQVPGTSISDNNALASTHSQGYNQGYLQSSGIYSTEANEVSGAYAYMSDTPQKF